MGNTHTTTFSFTSVEAALAAGHTQAEIDLFIEENPEVRCTLGVRCFALCVRIRGRMAGGWYC